MILKNKERLLSFEEPTRFIFSHSALREGWDNPNVFQICTLKHSDSQTAKRQEVGRGLRLCVNQFGNRMDVESCGDSVHDINMLTVIASESYKGFVADLQSDIKTVLYDRPTTATSEYFNGKYVKVDGTPTLIDKNTADTIEFYLISNGYVDMKRKVTDKWMRAIVAGTTFQDNMDLSLFYDQESRKFSEHGYIGLYKDKSIRAIGKLKKTIIAVEVEGKMTYRAESGEAPTPDEICRINEAIRRAEDYGYNLRTISHRYFMVEKFYPIDFRKSSKNPIQKSKFFNLADMFGYKTMPDTEKIAADLNGRTWEEF